MVLPYSNLLEQEFIQIERAIIALLESKDRLTALFDHRIWLRAIFFIEPCQSKEVGHSWIWYGRKKKENQYEFRRIIPENSAKVIDNLKLLLDYLKKVNGGHVESLI